jgi:long-chain acyl-CoA synthetase
MNIPIAPPLRKFDPFDFMKQQSVEIGKRKKGQKSTNPIRNAQAQDGLLHFRPDAPHVLTLYDNMVDAAKRFADQPCYGWREMRTVKGTQQLGSFKWLTYAQFFERAKKFGSGMRALGLQPRDFVGLWSKNRVEWVTAQCGADSQAMPAVALYDTFGVDIAQYIVNHAELQLVVCSAENVPKIWAFADKCPKLKYIVQMDGTIDDKYKSPSSSAKSPKSAKKNAAAAPAMPQVLSLDAVIALGTSQPFDPVPPRPNELALLMYTSGTTDLPKGVMHAHRALISATDCVEPAVGTLSPADRFLIFLPLAQIFERVMHACLLSRGCAIGFFSGDPRRLSEDLRELKPTIFAGVPKVYEKIYNDAQNVIAGSGSLRRKLFAKAYAAKSKSLQSRDLLFRQAEAQTGLWNKLVFKKVKAQIGGCVRIFISGAAPLSTGTAEFIKTCFGAPICQGYGLTETSACGAISMIDDPDLGHVGPPSCNVEFKLVDVAEMGYVTNTDEPEGEIWIRGPAVALGYYKDPTKTKESFDDDGWFHTGDIARWEKNGAVKIIDRKKNIFKVRGGRGDALFFH